MEEEAGEASGGGVVAEEITIFLEMLVRVSLLLMVDENEVMGMGAVVGVAKAETLAGKSSLLATNMITEVDPDMGTCFDFDLLNCVPLELNNYSN